MLTPELEGQNSLTDGALAVQCKDVKNFVETVNRQETTTSRGPTKTIAKKTAPKELMDTLLAGYRKPEERLVREGIFYGKEKR